MRRGEQVESILEGGTMLGLGSAELLGRFRASGDEAAFAALVARHGPMVLATCRRILPQQADADDAFQATFLVLARRAGAIVDPDRLAPWLHGVARRVSVRARTVAARRRIEGDEPGDVAAPPPRDDAELRSVLDEELARLPAKYRAPLVLCYLEGLTSDEAASQLAWPVGTVRSRLAGGRDRLRGRLARRGLDPAAGALPPVLPGALVVQSLQTATVRLALATAPGAVPSAVAILAQGVATSMGFSKIQMVLAVLALTTGVAAGAVLARRSEPAPVGGVGPAAAADPPAPQPPPQQPTPPPTPPRDPNIHPLTVAGRALDTDGRPIAGAQIFVGSTRHDDYRRLAETKTDAEGRYQFANVPLPIQPPADSRNTLSVGGFVVFGVAEGYGFAWRPTKRVVFTADLPEILGEEDAPSQFRAGAPIVLDLTFRPPVRVVGQVFDERGRPLAGAGVRIFNWEKARPDQPFAPTSFNGWSFLPPAILNHKTDERGNFALDGLPPDEQFEIDVTPPGFPGKRAAISTASEPPPAGRGGRLQVSPIALTFETPRDVPLRVTAGDTGQPLPRAYVGVSRLAGEHAWGSKLADADGRADLRLPPGEYRLSVLPEYRTPYLVLESRFAVPDADACPPVDAVMPAACILDVTVTDASGQPIADVDLWQDGRAADPDDPETRRRVVAVRSFQGPNLVRSDLPKTDAAGKLRTLVVPGARRVGVGFQTIPDGWVPVEPDGRAIDGKPGATLTLRFELRRRQR